MLAPKAEVGSWVSEAAREKFMAAYERAFALWPQPVEEFDVETATATTRVHAYRPHPGGEPVVLLTGAGFNASGWYPHVAALATACRYTVSTRPATRTRASCAPRSPRRSPARPGWMSCSASSATARRTWSGCPGAAGWP